MCIHNEGSLVDVARSESSGLNSEQACQGVTDPVRRGNFIHLLELEFSQKNPSDLLAGDSDSGPGCGAFSDTWSKARARRPRGGGSPE